MIRLITTTLLLLTLLMAGTAAMGGAAPLLEENVEALTDQPLAQAAFGEASTAAARALRSAHTGPHLRPLAPEP